MTRNRPLPVPLEDLPHLIRLDQLTPPLAWAALFGREAPLELEIGSGKGLFLVEAARRRPGSDFVGVERAGKWFQRSAHRLLSAGLGNIRVARTDAFDFLARWVPPGSVSAVHIYFPDPWPKKRHAKRRLLQSAFFRLVERAVRRRGSLYLASDVGPYFTAATAVLAEATGFRQVDWPVDPEEPLPTHYARKYAQQGRTVRYARFTRLIEPSARPDLEIDPATVLPSPPSEGG